MRFEEKVSFSALGQLNYVEGFVSSVVRGEMVLFLAVGEMGKATPVKVWWFFT